MCLNYIGKFSVQYSRIYRYNPWLKNKDIEVKQNFMRKCQLLIVMFSLFFLSFISFGAQDEIAEIIQNIEKSTVLIITYDNEGNPIERGAGFFINEGGELITKHNQIELKSGPVEALFIPLQVY